MNVRSKSMVPMTAVGTIVQIAMVVAGHYNEFIKNNVFAIGGMLISLVVAAMWAAKGAASKGNAFGGGAIVGGVCAILGIALSVILGDTDAAVLGFGTAGSAVAGGIGGIAAFALGGRKVAPAG
ncbi:hypothetical protein RAS2_22340 [Phycisphaerae bacterium RAS2]|nr:hypothetical protein RAS2_22340 [Phycisphaerae bacterium RAS2]